MIRIVSYRPFRIIPDASAYRADPVFRFFFKLATYPTPMGIITPLYAGTSPEVENLNGEYLSQWDRVGTPRHNDPVLGKELWTWLEEQVEGRGYLNKIRASLK